MMEDEITTDQFQLLAERAGYEAVQREVEWAQSGYEGEHTGETFNRDAWFIENQPSIGPAPSKIGGCHTKEVAWQFFLATSWKPHRDMNHAREIIDGLRSGKGSCWNFYFEAKYGGYYTARFKYYCHDDFTGESTAMIAPLAVCLAALEALKNARHTRTEADLEGVQAHINTRDCEPMDEETLEALGEVAGAAAAVFQDGWRLATEPESDRQGYFKKDIDKLPDGWRWY